MKMNEDVKMIVFFEMAKNSSFKYAYFEKE